MKPKYLFDQDPWLLAEDIPDMDFFFSQIWLSCFVNEFKSPVGRAYKKILSVYQGYHLWFYFGEKDSNQVGEHIVDRFLADYKFTTQVNKRIIIEADKLRALALKLPEDRLAKLTNRQLWLWYDKHYRVHTHYYQWCWIPVGADMFHNNLTRRLKGYLRGLNVSEDKINEYLVLLTQPINRSLIQLEQEEFLIIAARVWRNKKQRELFEKYFKSLKKQAILKLELNVHTPAYEEFMERQTAIWRDKIDKRILKFLADHYRKYFYVKFMWLGQEGVTSFEYYLKEMARLISAGANPLLTLRKMRNELAAALRQRTKLIKKLKIKNPWRTIIDGWGDFMVTKIYRRYAQIYAIYRMQPILEEIAKRLKVNLRQVRFMRRPEVQAALLKNKIDRNNLKQRSKLCVFYAERGRNQVFTGQAARKIVKGVEKKPDYGQALEVKGQTGFIGRARGRVRIIIRPKDMAKMQKGDILVSIATDPDIVPAMKKAAAIVTEQGGITSHAAIVSRELGIPCVIGTKIATKVFKDGDYVEVDANRGVVKKIEKR